MIDFHGIGRSKLVPKYNVAKYMKNGIAYCSFISVASVTNTQITMIPEIVNTEKNFLVVADPTTFHSVPWAGQGKVKIGEVLCNSYWAKDEPALNIDTRAICQKQLSKLDSLGYEFMSTSEMEFQVFKQNGEPVYEGRDYMINVRTTETEDIWLTIDQYMQRMGVPSEYFEVEFGRGQFEYALIPQMGIKAVDNMFLFKNGVKEIMIQKDLIASFMTKPHNVIDMYQHVNGLHMNHSVWTKDGRNALHDSKADDNLSEIAKYWLAGNIKHMAALTALCAPTVNCYRRLHTAGVPNNANWGIENRLTSIRVKNYDEKATYFEHRLPCGSTNPYLAIAGIVAAGIDGIVNNLECPPQLEGDSLPMTLTDAIKALKADKYMVDALGEDFVNWWSQCKEETEINFLPGTRHEDDATYEKERYLYLNLL
ncbi:unnamed protein product [Owenia fusiformis]|nr:unnamed protein product [Owenia fusiformis]